MMRDSATFWDFVKVRSAGKMGTMDMTANEPPAVALIMGTVNLWTCGLVFEKTLVAAAHFRQAGWTPAVGMRTQHLSRWVLATY
jgi:hypothetical protein